MTHYRSNPVDGILYSMSYGQMPKKKQFMRAYRKELGDEDTGYQMLLRGDDDTSAAEDTIFADAIDREEHFDADDVWKGLKQLKRKWEAGDDEAGDLASGILYTLNIEWI